MQMPVPTLDIPPRRLTMPVPDPALAPTPASPTTPRPHPMDSALNQLTAIPAQLNAGPALRSVDRALDSLGGRIP